MNYTIEGKVALVPAINKAKVSTLLNILDALSGFYSVYSEEKRKLPYSINLLDELHANENAHSRILSKLLQFPEKIQDQTFYPILDLFLKKLEEPFSNLVQHKLIITCEKHRIDLLIHDTEYAIIIENKINGAVDQGGQLKNYYDKIKKSIPENKIYMLYLSSHGGSPSIDSLPTEVRISLGNRYREIDYQNTIFSFLTNDVHKYITSNKEQDPTVRNMQAALEQYIDYLAGRFHIREGEKNMREALQKYIADALGMVRSSDGNLNSDINYLSLLQEKRGVMGEMVATLDGMEEDLLGTLAAKARDELVKRVNLTGQANQVQGNFGDFASRIRFFPQDWNKQYCISVAFDGNMIDFFIGIENIENKKYTGNPTDPVYEPLRVLLGKSDSPKGPSNHWPYIKYLAREKESVIDYFTDSNEIEELSKRIMKMAENPYLLAILNENSPKVGTKE